MFAAAKLDFDHLLAVRCSSNASLTPLLHHISVPPVQVVYSEEVAAMRSRALLQARHLPAALAACNVLYEAKEHTRRAPWRAWLIMQVCVCACVRYWGLLYEVGAGYM